ncbi:MAG: shikimate dehydrogenase [Chitinophagaceae bacterium]
MRQFGLLGYPLTHSFSKKYFTEKFLKEGLNDCSYENFSMPNIEELHAVLQNNSLLSGLNVTIPYKEQVLDFLSEESDVVKKIRACNCIKIKNGKLTGYNTDVTGFEVSLKQKLLPHHKNALILGTGGAAKAVEFVLSNLGIHYRYVSRSSNGDNFSYADLNADLISTYTLIVNTTPLGMYPNVESFPPIPYEALGSQHYLFDLVYNPAKTLFLQKGETHGALIKNGDDMLVIQAEESWRIWNDPNC